MIYAAIRKGDGMIKIGTSRFPAQRVQNQKLTLLATWEGSYHEEKKAHLALWASRCNTGKIRGRNNLQKGPKEWFRPTRRVMDYIEMMRDRKLREPNATTISAIKLTDGQQQALRFFSDCRSRYTSDLEKFYVNRIERLSDKGLLDISPAYYRKVRITREGLAWLLYKAEGALTIDEQETYRRKPKAGETGK